MSEPGRIVTQAPPLGRLAAFEKVSWLKEYQASEGELARRLGAFPQGIFLLPVDGEDVSQVTVSPKDVPTLESIEGFEQMRDIPVHQESRTLWITNLATKMGKRGGGYLTTLLRYVLGWAGEQGYGEIVTGITCYGLKDAKEQGLVSSPQDYMQKGMNPALRAIQKAARASGVETWNSDPIPNYWEDDSDSLGYGVLVRIILVED